MKKTIAILISIIIVMSIFPEKAHAADGTITTSGTYDISAYGNDSVLTIEAGLTVTLTNTTDVLFYHMQIICEGANTNLTINNVQINTNGFDGTYAISFEGAGNTLTLVGSSYLYSGDGASGIRVEEGTELEISGSGSLEVRGGLDAAGIGAGKAKNCGTITFSGDVVVDSKGASGAAGIGGGLAGDGGDITIKDNVKITAEALFSGNGIGNGYLGDGGTVIIEGGIVLAAGTEANGYYDISADNFSYLSFQLSGNTAVYFKNNKFTMVMANLQYFPSKTIDSYGKVYGIKLPAGWTEASVYCRKLIEVSYDANGAGGVVHESHYSLRWDNFDFTVDNGDSLVYNGRYLYKWNLAPDESGTEYLRRATYNTGSDLVLYAIWKKFISGISLDKNTLSITDGETSKLNAEFIPDGSYAEAYWSSSNNSVAVVDQSGNVTGKGPGTATIKVTSYTESETCVVTVSEIPVTTVSLNYGSKSLYEGDAFSLKAIVLPSDASNPGVTWASSDETVATVSSNGVVEAKAKGSCTITATAGGVTDSCVITVSRNSVTSISLDASSKSLYIGEVFALNATVSPSDASDGKVTWDSSDYTVASVNSSGVVTARGEGTAAITATAGGKSDSCTITVSREKVSVESVSLSMGDDAMIVMYVGDTMMFSANVSPTNADNQSVAWESSNSAVASVTSFGKVTALSEGEAVITVSAGDKTDSYKVSVKAVEQEGEESAGEESDGGSQDNPETDNQPTPAPAPTVEVVYAVQVDTTGLPYGAQYIELPNGEIVELNGQDTVSCEISGSELENGAFKIVALDADKKAIGAVDVAAENGGVPVIWLIIIAVATLILGAGAMLIAVRAAAVKKK